MTYLDAAGMPTTPIPGWAQQEAYVRLMALRSEIETTLDKMLEQLNAIDAITEDLEDGGDQETDNADQEPLLGATEYANQTHSWTSTGIKPGALHEPESDEDCDRELENEHGGDINDEPHDPNEEGFTEGGRAPQEQIDAKVDMLRREGRLNQRHEFWGGAAPRYLTNAEAETVGRARLGLPIQRRAGGRRRG